MTAPAHHEIISVVGLSLDMAVARLLPASADDDLVMRLAGRYKDAFGERRRRAEIEEPLYPGVGEVIAKLAGRDDVLLGIATGKSRRGLKAVLEREGMSSLFATLQTADTNPSKPHPGMIFAAISETGAAPENTVMIGDTTFDIEMALNAGAKAIGVGWGYHPAAALHKAGAHAVSESAAELTGAIERLLLGESMRE